MMYLKNDIVSMKGTVRAKKGDKVIITSQRGDMYLVKVIFTDDIFPVHKELVSNEPIANERAASANRHQDNPSAQRVGSDKNNTVQRARLPRPDGNESGQGSLF